MFFAAMRRVNYFINQICRCRGRALLSFVLRKRVTRESNLRGVIAKRSSPLKNPLFSSARALARTAPRVSFLIMLPKALCALCVCRNNKGVLGVRLRPLAVRDKGSKKNWQRKKSSLMKREQDGFKNL